MLRYFDRPHSDPIYSHVYADKRYRHCGVTSSWQTMSHEGATYRGVTTTETPHNKKKLRKLRGVLLRHQPTASRDYHRRTYCNLLRPISQDTCQNRTNKRVLLKSSKVLKTHFSLWATQYILVPVSIPVREVLAHAMALCI